MIILVAKYWTPDLCNINVDQFWRKAAILKVSGRLQRDDDCAPMRAFGHIVKDSITRN